METNYDLVGNDLPICPNCGHEINDEDVWGLNLTGNDDVIETGCVLCEKDFLFKVQISYSYTTCHHELEDYYEE